MISTIGWLIPAVSGFIAFAVWGTLVYGAQRAGVGGRFVAISGAAIFGWLGAAIALGSSGSVLPTLLFALVFPVIAVITAFRRSSDLDAVLNAVPLPWLAGIQLYRVIGAVFLALYFGDLLPGGFALPAGAGDVVVGLAAPVVAWMFVKRAQGSGFTLLGWNLVGVLDLVIAVATGFVISPNELITAWPLVLVPAFVVPLSILLHLSVFRKLKFEMAILADEKPAQEPRPSEGWISRLMAI